MRIVGGDLKGRRIKIPKTPGLRPSTEKTREAVFSTLGDNIVDTGVADLFCGSGALGLEALSRGAKRASFIDSSKAAISTVRQNVESLDLTGKSDIRLSNVLSIRPRLLRDIFIIFADPPYRKNYGDRLMALLSLHKFDWYGILVLEHESEWRFEGSDFEALKRIDFGDSAVSFMRRWNKPR